MASYRDRLPVSGGGGAVIKSVQHGFAALVTGNSTSVVIKAVDMSRSIVLISFSADHALSVDKPLYTVCTARLASATLLSISRFTSASQRILVSWQVIEYESGVSVQRGTISNSGVAFSTSISPVDVSKSYTVHTSAPYGTDATAVQAQVYGGLSSSTELNFSRFTNFGPTSIDWQVVSYV